MLRQGAFFDIPGKSKWQAFFQPEVRFIGHLQLYAIFTPVLACWYIDFNKVKKLLFGSYRRRRVLSFNYHVTIT